MWTVADSLSRRAWSCACPGPPPGFSRPKQSARSITWRTRDRHGARPGSWARSAGPTVWAGPSFGDEVTVPTHQGGRLDEALSLAMAREQSPQAGQHGPAGRLQCRTVYRASEHRDLVAQDDGLDGEVGVLVAEELDQLECGRERTPDTGTRRPSKDARQNRIIPSKSSSGAADSVVGTHKLRARRTGVATSNPSAVPACHVLPVPASPHLGVGTLRDDYVTRQHGRKVRIVQGWGRSSVTGMFTRPDLTGSVYATAGRRRSGAPRPARMVRR